MPGEALFKGDLARMRALMILKRKVTAGLSNAHLAEEFGVSQNTIQRQIQLALKDTAIADFETQLFADLVPVAMSAVKTAMENGNAAVAIEILKGAGLLKKQSDKPSGGAEGDELEIHIRSKRTPNGDDFTPSAQGPLSSLRDGLTGASSPAQASPRLLPAHDLHRLPNEAELVARHDGPRPSQYEPPDSLEGELAGDN